MRDRPLSATGQVTSRGSRRGATAAIKEHGSGPGARDACVASPSPIATCRTSGEDNPRDLKGARCTAARVNRRLIAHGASERGRRVGPRVAEGSEAGLLVGDRDKG